MQAIINYGPIKQGQRYRVLDESSDWLLIVVRGKPVHVFKWVFYDK